MEHNENEHDSMSAVMVELKYIREQVDKISHELAGNGGPGIRTRIYALETGYQHLERKLREIETQTDKTADCIEVVSRRVERIYYVVAGIGAAWIIFQALQVLLPALTP